jgi:hypothetical protein
MQKTFNPPISLTPIQLAWLAGITDGEGCIHIHKTKANPKKGEITTKYCLRLRIAMTSRETIKHIQTIVGFGNFYTRKPQKKTYRTQYAWEASSLQASAFLMMILPYMVTKKEEAQLGIEYMEIPRVFCMKQGISPKILQKRQRIYYALKEQKR